ncbi:hypothetical protein RCC89_16370 [Cytophagaceae bacterium ABcell3]|nr:hypothetical protein RCC89_16370 [Cytophagaceae bacterium ABcell3]
MKLSQKRTLILILLLLPFYTSLKGCEHYESLPKQLAISDTSDVYTPDSITVAAGPHYKRGGLHNLFFGKHYRPLWAEPVKMPVFDIGEMGDSLYAVKRGGGQQTMNIRLKDKNKRQYVLRSVDKDQVYVVPENYRLGLVKFFLRDQASAMNPYAALVVPPLADAAGILHANPKLFYVPYDERFGEFADLVANRVMMFEEFPNKHWAGTSFFGNADKLVKTTKFLKRRYKKQDVVVDEKAFARARLFDVWIGDWDRHRNQWRWAEYRQDDKRIYKPIPRDRDIVFYRFNDGLLTYIASRWFIMPKLHSFEHHYGSIKNMMINSKYTDNLLLSSLVKEDWIEIAKDLQENLTDEAIEHAIKQWPPEVFKHEGEATIEKLKNRREFLVEAAEEFYIQLNKEVTLIGTDKEERFYVNRIDHKHTEVIITNADSSEVFFHRTFDNKITKTICLHGLEGDDYFLVTGEASRSPFVNIYGGKGEDTIIDRSNVKGLRRHTTVYDTREGNHVEFGRETKDRRSNDPSILDIDREGWN